MPNVFDPNVETLVGFYRTASSKIIQTVNSVTDFSRDRKIQALAQIDVILGELDQESQSWLEQKMKQAYIIGKNDTVTLLDGAGVTIAKTFSQIDKEAVKVMTSEAFTYFGEAISGVKRHMTQILDQATKQRITALLTEGKITGATKNQISNSIAGLLKDGFIALKDRAGREWKIENYADMLARTKLLEATNQGMKNALLADGYDLVQVTDHQGSCGMCAPFEGKIYSISGNSSKYPALKAAEEGGLFHPNCKHRVVPYHADFATQSKHWSTDLQKYV